MENHTQNMVETLSQDPFLENHKVEHIYVSIVKGFVQFIYVCLYLAAHHLLLTPIKFFNKQKKVWN